MKSHRWNPQKAIEIAENASRGFVTFEQCVIAIQEGRVLDIIVNPNRPNQKVYVLEINRYVYAVPFVETDDYVFLKTIYPSRKLLKRYFR
jgi:hypothetical protein